MLHRNAGWYGRVLILLAAGIAACNSDDTLSVPSNENVGTLEIVTTTTGAEADPDGYIVQVDAQNVGAIGASATMDTQVTAGDHTVELTGLATGCTVTGENPRSVSVVAGQIMTLSFAVSCGSDSGNLQISSSTTGPGTDDDGYSVTLDGTDRGAITPSGQVSLDGVPAGEHEVGLSGVAANCQVEGDNPRLVTVATSGTSVSFAVTCSVPPANAGSLRITTATTGADLDPNGYRLVVDRGTVQPIGVNATATLSNVAAGNHAVRISGLSQNCTVQGANPQTVTVAAGATTELSFSVTCEASSGTIQVHTATTGASPDPDGYTVSVDGGAAQSIGVNATIQFPGVGVGSHQVTLAGLASNCSVQDNPRSVTVATAATAAVDFAVSCPAASGSSWTAMTSGTTKDLRYIWGSSASSVFAAGVNQDCSISHCGEMSILHYNGSGWTTQYTNSGGVLGLWAAPDGQAFVLAEGDQPGPILHYDGQQWSPMAVQPPPPPDPNSQDITLRSIWGTSSTDVFAVGSWFDGLQSRGYVVHYDGSQWVPMDLGGADGIHLSDVWGNSANDVYAVGQYSPEDAEPSEERAIVLHYNGQGWSEVLRQGDLALGNIWGSSAADVYATGSSGGNGAVWHYNGSAWSPMQVPATSPLGSIWGSSSSDIYVLGREPGNIWHYDGSAWKQIDTGSSKGLADIWGSSAGDVFAVGNDGTILHGP
jgi:hypothetical protein